MASYKQPDRRGKAFHKEKQKPIPEGRILFTKEMERTLDGWQVDKTLAELERRVGASTALLVGISQRFHDGQRATIGKKLWEKIEAAIEAEV